MRRLIPGLALALALLAVGTVTRSEARVSAHINLNFGSPPFVVYDRAPSVVLVPGTDVYTAEGLPYEMYRYGAYWYVCDDGAWFRARSYRGPWAAVDFGYVPDVVVSCSPRFGGRVYDRGYDRGWDGGGRAYLRGWSGRDGDRRWERGDRGWERGDRDRDRERGDRGWSRERTEQRDRGEWRDGGRDRGDRGDRGWERGDRGRGNGRGHGDHGDRGRGHGRGHGDGDDDD